MKKLEAKEQECLEYRAKLSNIQPSVALEVEKPMEEISGKLDFQTE